MADPAALDGMVCKTGRGRFAASLLLFRDQRLTMSDQRRVVGYVGPVLDRASGYVAPDDDVLKTPPLDYHSDLASTPHPNDAVSLYASEVDDDTSWTGFVSGQRAYALLPQAVRTTIDSLDMVMVDTLENKSLATFDAQQDAYNVTRPIIMQHKVTGKPIIYCSESATARIDGWDREASDALLKDLFARLYDRENELRHVWRNGDLVLWDNLALQHCRPALDENHKRTLQRVVAGQGTRMELNPDYKLSPVYTSSD